MDKSIFLITVRRFRTGSVDIRMCGDNEEKFRSIIDNLPGTFHYKKSLSAYKTIKPLDGELISEAFINYILDNVEPLIIKNDMILRIVFEKLFEENSHQRIRNVLSRYFIRL